MQNFRLLILVSVIGIGFLIPSLPTALFSGDSLPADTGDTAEKSPPDGAKEIHTLSGTVVKIDRMEKSHGVRLGMHLTLRTPDNRAVRVHLCRCCELELEGMKIRKKDLVEVRGDYRDVCGNRELFATEITKNGKTVRFKKPSGTP